MLTLNSMANYKFIRFGVHMENEKLEKLSRRVNLLDTVPYHIYIVVFSSIKNSQFISSSPISLPFASLGMVTVAECLAR